MKEVLVKAAGPDYDEIWDQLHNEYVAEEMNKKHVSTCCHARLNVEGRTTMYYSCRTCGEPCDFTYKSMIKRWATNLMNLLRNMKEKL